MAARRILLGVTGGIAAYKSAELVRQLKKAGHEVRVVMTRGAEAFVAPLTFQALSGEPVRTSLLDPEAEAGMGHIELAKWADQLVVAPASADFIARLAQGMADDLLTTVCCATEAPIAVVPAMNQAMWSNGVPREISGCLKRIPRSNYGGRLRERRPVVIPGQGECWSRRTLLRLSITVAQACSLARRS